MKKAKFRLALPLFLKGVLAAFVLFFSVGALHAQTEANQLVSDLLEAYYPGASFVSSETAVQNLQADGESLYEQAGNVTTRKAKYGTEIKIAYYRLVGMQIVKGNLSVEDALIATYPKLEEMCAGTKGELSSKEVLVDVIGLLVE